MTRKAPTEASVRLSEPRRVTRTWNVRSHGAAPRRAQALAFSTDASGTRTASADLVGLVFNSDGAQVDTISTGFDITLEKAAAEQAMKNGLVYIARVPIKRPGGYQLRFAVRDRRSRSARSAGS